MAARRLHGRGLGSLPVAREAFEVKATRGSYEWRGIDPDDRQMGLQGQGDGLKTWVGRTLGDDMRGLGGACGGEEFDSGIAGADFQVRRHLLEALGDKEGAFERDAAGRG